MNRDQRTPLTHATSRGHRMQTYLALLVGTTLFVPTLTHAQFFDALQRAVGSVTGGASAPVNDKPAEAEKFSPISRVAAFVTADSGAELDQITTDLNRSGMYAGTDGAKEYIAVSDKVVAGCRFPDESSAYKKKFASGRGLVAPVFRTVADVMTGKSESMIIDWPATERLHRSLTNGAKLNVLPMAETRRYWQALEKYMLSKMQSDRDDYVEISNSGGGIFGQLIGAARDKNGSFTRVTDPNHRLGGFIRPDFFESVLTLFPEATYLVSANEGQGIDNYYGHLQAEVWKSLSIESLALNLQKDVRGLMKTSAAGGRLYYYGVISERRANESSTLGLIASSALKVNFHADMKGDELRVLRGERDVLQKLVELDSLLQEMRSSMGMDFSISNIDKYREMKRVGVDNERIFCAAYNLPAAKKLVQTIERIAAIRGARSAMLNPIVFTFKVKAPDYQSELKNHFDEVQQIFSVAPQLLKDLLRDRQAVEEVLHRDLLAKAFAEAGYTGYISSQRLR